MESSWSSNGAQDYFNRFDCIQYLELKLLLNWICLGWSSFYLCPCFDHGVWNSKTLLQCSESSSKSAVTSVICIQRTMCPIYTVVNPETLLHSLASWLDSDSLMVTSVCVDSDYTDTYVGSLPAGRAMLLIIIHYQWLSNSSLWFSVWLWPAMRTTMYIFSKNPIPDMVLPMYNNIHLISHMVDRHQRWHQLNLVFKRLNIHNTKTPRIIILLLLIQQVLCPLTPLVARVVIHHTNNNIEIQLHHRHNPNIPKIIMAIMTILIPHSMITLLNITILSLFLGLRHFQLVHIQHLKELRLKSILDLFLVLVLLHLQLYLVPITMEDQIRLVILWVDHGNHITTITCHLRHHRPSANPGPSTAVCNSTT